MKMPVMQLMTNRVKTVGIDASAAKAAQVMWDGDCGCVLVVDAQARLAGLVTDRDLCMAAYTQGQTLQRIPVAAVMAQWMITCTPDESAGSVLELMRLHQIRRVPVIDAERRVVGIVSVNDVMRALPRERQGSTAEMAVIHTLEAICRPRCLAPPGHVTTDTSAVVSPR